MAKKNTTTTTTSSSTNVVVHDFTSADLKVLHKKVTMYNAVVKQLAEDTADKDGKKFKSILFGSNKDKNVYRTSSEEELKALKEGDDARTALKDESGKALTSVFGYVFMLTESTDELRVKFAGCTYSISDNGKDKDGKRNKNGIAFVSGHGISKKKWDLKKKDRKGWSENDSKACEYYDKADKLLIDQYCFADINVARRINDIASRVEAAVDAEKKRLIDTIGVKEYNRLYNALESEKEESEEEVA